ncbi:MAG: FKBP-type peptidyl-prolyl cis-trans isomerase [Flavobacteriales bacterium]|nr:FKBP-type peptidyl-prolyl cis-trans isomerase [Flavobacteriales bacterium]
MIIQRGYYLISGALLSVLILSSCDSASKSNATLHLYTDSIKEVLIETNQNLTQTENLRIQAYINRMKWPMEETGSGLRYWVYQRGEGDSINQGDVVQVSYTISLLNGQVCYKSDSSEVQSFKVGMSDVESGLDEAMTYLNVGDYAKLVVPPHLAHGLLGDRNKIPGNATLVYDLTIVSKGVND